MHRFAFALSLVLLAPQPGLLAQGEALELGKPAPEIELSAVLQAPVSSLQGLAELRGKAVVLDFWATWCAPCRQTIPHLNRLHEALMGEPVQFISVTDDSEETVREFVKQIPIRGWIGIDPGGGLFRRYGVFGIPRTVLIDAAGAVRGVVHPATLTLDHLNALMMGGWETLASITPEAYLAGAAGRPSRVRQAVLRPSQHKEPVVGRSEDGSLEMMGFSALGLIEALWGIDRSRIKLETDLPQQSYDLKLPSLQGSRLLLQKTVEVALGVKVSTSVEPRAVFVLTQGGDAFTRKGTRPPSGRPGWTGNRLLAATSEHLAQLLSRRLKAPVADETGLEGGFDLSFEFDPESETIQQAVSEQLGLKLVREQRPAQILIVSSPPEPRRP